MFNNTELEMEWIQKRFKAIQKSIEDFELSIGSLVRYKIGPLVKYKI